MLDYQSFNMCYGFVGHPKIIHRDIKAANILLDYNFEAKVRSFAVSLLGYCYPLSELAFIGLTLFIRLLILV